MQKQKAELLRALHHADTLLLLPNVWDPIGARVLAAKNYPAVATASAAISAALGYQDHEHLQRSTMIEFIGRIARSVDVPVTADIETGYGESLAELEETARLVIECGVVGVNVEDIHCAGGLRPVAEQCRRIAAFRKVADRLDVPLVINARIDSFIPAMISGRTDAAETAASINEAATRAADYAAAGADCIYPIGVRDESTIRALRDRIHVPLNILATPTASPLSVLQSIGVNRVSFGPKIFGACLQRFVEIADMLQTTGDYACLSPAISPGDFRKYLRSERE